jgi:hypothetical protein
VTAPVVAYPLAAVDNQELPSAPLQVIAGRQAGLAGADDQRPMCWVVMALSCGRSLDARSAGCVTASDGTPIAAVPAWVDLPTGAARWLRSSPDEHRPRSLS